MIRVFLLLLFTQFNSTQNKTTRYSLILALTTNYVYIISNLRDLSICICNYSQFIYILLISM